MYIIISWNITIWSDCNNYSSWQHPVGWKLFATLQFSFNFPSCKSSFIHIYPVGYFQYIFCGILVWHFECVCVCVGGGMCSFIVAALYWRTQVCHPNLLTNFISIYRQVRLFPTKSPFHPPPPEKIVQSCFTIKI